MTVKRGMVAVAGVAIVIGVLTLIVGLPVVRTAGYRAMVSEYGRAIPAQPINDRRQPLKWNFELPVPGGVTIRVQAPDHMGVVKVQYPDEPSPRTLYEYEDYSTPIAIGMTGNKLFVHWEEALLHTDHWLLAYDLENRREIERRRVDPRDLPAVK